MAQTQSQWLSPDFVAKLNALELYSRRIFMGHMRGERRSKRRGESVEFDDYRNYVVGDDLRFVDWNVYARLDQLFLKLFLEEEDLHLTLLLDVSKSMEWGRQDKAQYIRQIAAALSYIGLINQDRISLYSYSNGLREELKGLRGRRMMAQVSDFLTNARNEGTSNLWAACKQFVIRNPQPGIVILLSDFFEKGSYDQGLRYLQGRKYDIYCLQVLTPEELEPDLSGDLQLQDIEDNDRADVTVTRALLNRYKANLQAYCEGLKGFCARRGMNYLFTTTNVPFEQIIMQYFRRRGLIK